MPIKRKLSLLTVAAALVVVFASFYSGSTKASNHRGDEFAPGTMDNTLGNEKSALFEVLSLHNRPEVLNLLLPRLQTGAVALGFDTSMLDKGALMSIKVLRSRKYGMKPAMIVDGANFFGDDQRANMVALHEAVHLRQIIELDHRGYSHEVLMKKMSIFFVHYKLTTKEQLTDLLNAEDIAYTTECNFAKEQGTTSKEPLCLVYVEDGHQAMREKLAAILAFVDGRSEVLEWLREAAR